MELNISGLGTNDYIIANVEQKGYYRVMYDEPNWVLIAKELDEGNFHHIPPNTRAMLIDDAAAFVETDILDMRIFLDITKYLKLEVDSKNNKFYLNNENFLPD